MKQASPKKMCPIKQSVDQSKQRICSNFVSFHSFRGIRFYGFIGFDSIMNKNISSNSIEVYFLREMTRFSWARKRQHGKKNLH